MNQPQQQQQQQQGVAGGNGTQGPSQSPLALMQVSEDLRIEADEVANSSSLLHPYLSITFTFF